MGYGFLPSEGNKQQEHATRHTNRLPALFPVLDTLQPGDVQRIVEDQGSGFEADAVFLQI